MPPVKRLLPIALALALAACAHAPEVPPPAEVAPPVPVAPPPVVPAIDRIRESQMDEVVVTNTIPLNDEAKGCKNIRQLSVAFLFAETIRRISDGESVTSLFAEQNNNF